MSEVRELPHEVLLRRYGLNISQLSNHTQQLKKDLDKVLLISSDEQAAMELLM